MVYMRLSVPSTTCTNSNKGGFSYPLLAYYDTSPFCELISVKESWFGRDDNRGGRGVLGIGFSRFDVGKAHCY